jgi:hypothetical protein
MVKLDGYFKTYEHHKVCLEMSKSGFAVEGFVGVNMINSLVVSMDSKVGVCFLHVKQTWLSVAVPQIIGTDAIYVAYGLMPRTAGGLLEKVQRWVNAPSRLLLVGRKLLRGMGLDNSPVCSGTSVFLRRTTSVSVWLKQSAGRQIQAGSEVKKINAQQCSGKPAKQVYPIVRLGTSTLGGREGLV